MILRPLLTRACLLLCAFGAVAYLFSGISQTAHAPQATPQQGGGAERDGQHDFDFAIGVWRPQISRRLHPLTGSTTWIKYEGRTVIQKVWDGRAQLVELEADGSAGHLEILCLRLYNPQSHQWSLNYANSTDGSLSPPVIGKFKDGHGDFLGQDQLHGKPIYVRNVISDITPSSMHFEQAFSEDAGKTWETNFIETLTRNQSRSGSSP